MFNVNLYGVLCFNVGLINESLTSPQKKKRKKQLEDSCDEREVSQKCKSYTWLITLGH